MNYALFKKRIVSMALMFIFAFSTVAATVTPAFAQWYYPRQRWERRVNRDYWRTPYRRTYRDPWRSYYRGGWYGRYGRPYYRPYYRGGWYGRYGRPYYRPSYRRPFPYAYPYGGYGRYGRFRWGIYY